MHETFTRLLFLAHVAATLYMTGLIWFVQIVHYPLFVSVGDAGFSAYERRHTVLTTRVVGPPMLVEGITALILFWLRPGGVTGAQLSMGVALLAVIWTSTAFIQVPCHELLSQKYDKAVHQRLVWSNWRRTIGWSVRALLVLWMVWATLQNAGESRAGNEQRPAAVEIGLRAGATAVPQEIRLFASGLQTVPHHLVRLALLGVLSAGEDIPCQRQSHFSSLLCASSLTCLVPSAKLGMA